jgi:Uma2 family endonuclease
VVTSKYAMPKLLHTQSEPTWAIAELFPNQGTWTEDEYLDLHTNRLVELSDGCLELLPIPTTSHQRIVAYLFGLLLAHVTSRDLGTVLFAPLRMKLASGKFREPDVIFMAKVHSDRIHEEFWKGADLVMEVVSGEDEDRRRDLETKRREYARAKIGEYWIVDPLEQRISILRLVGKRYVSHGEFHVGAMATSDQLPGFTVDVSAVFSLAVNRTRKSRR